MTPRYLNLPPGKFGYLSLLKYVTSVAHTGNTSNSGRRPDTINDVTLPLILNENPVDCVTESAAFSKSGNDGQIYGLISMSMI